MKRYLPLLLVLCVGCSKSTQLSGPIEASVEAAAPTPKHNAHYVKAELPCYYIGNDVDWKGKVPIINDTDHPVTFRDVRSTHSHAPALLVGEKTLAPGESAVLRIHPDFGMAHRGRQSLNYVLTTDDERCSWYVEVVVHVREAVLFSNEWISFGSLRPGSERTLTTYFVVCLRQPNIEFLLESLTFTSSNPDVEVRPIPGSIRTTPLADGFREHVLPLEVTVMAGEAGGPHASRILANDPGLEALIRPPALEVGWSVIAPDNAPPKQQASDNTDFLTSKGRVFGLR
jgi:hypothetical protein